MNPAQKVAKRLLQRVPALRAGWRKAYSAWERLSIDERRRWIRGTYHAFGQSSRRSLFLSIARFHHINRPSEGYYFEFGSHEANTMRIAWDTFRHLFDYHYVAFDSFEGLPEIEPIDEQEIWEKGKLATSERHFRQVCTRHGMPAESLTTVKGFYDQTLNDELADRLLPNRAAVIYIDCDLYASTVPVLTFIRPFLQRGTVIVFDDWFCFHGDPQRGEQRAWREFLAEHPDLRFVEFISTQEAKAFIYLGSVEDLEGVQLPNSE